MRHIHAVRASAVGALIAALLVSGSPGTAGVAGSTAQIPEYVVNAGPHGTLRYYVNEITVRSMSADWQDAGFRLIFRLESVGAGHCRD